MGSTHQVGRWLGLSAALLLAACGGESRREFDANPAKPDDAGPSDALPEPSFPMSASPADAVLRLADTTGAAELRAAWLGQEGSKVLGYVDGRAVLSPDRYRVFLERSEGSLIAAVDGAEHSVSLAVGFGLAWSPDGERLALIEPAGIPAVADADGEQAVELSSAAGDYFGPLSWAPDGSRVAFSLGTSIIQADRDGLATATTVTGPTPSNGDVAWALTPVWAPNSRWLAVVSPEQDLIFIDTDGSTTLFAIDAVPPALGWSFDGTWFAVKSAAGTCDIADPVGVFKPGVRSCSVAAWSPVQNLLAAISESEVVVWDPYTGLTSVIGQTGGTRVSWSPDGSVLAFESRDAASVSFVDLTLDPPGVIAEVPARDFAWNEAGTRLWSWMDDGSLTTADGRAGETRTIASDVRAVTWLPDGESLAVATSATASFLRFDGSGARLVATIDPSIAEVGWLEPQPR